jgi:hypothetical protein
MDSSTYSIAGPDWLAARATAADGLAAQDLAGLPDAARAQRAWCCGGCSTGWKGTG